MPEIKTVSANSQIGVMATSEGVALYPSMMPPPKPPPPGPGTHLHNLFGELGLNGWSGCPCAARARQMDAWGVEGCQEHRAEIIGWMKEAREHLTWMEMLKAATKLAFKVNPLSPLDSLLDEAIRRSAGH